MPTPPAPPLPYMTALARDVRELAATVHSADLRVQRLGSVAAELGEMVETLTAALETLDLGQELTDRLLAEAQRGVHLALAQVRAGFAKTALVVCARCARYDVRPLPATCECGGAFVRSRLGCAQ